MSFPMIGGQDSMGLRTMATLALWIGFIAPLAAHTAAEEASAADVVTPPGRIEFVGHNLFGDANGIFHSWRVVSHNLKNGSIDGLDELEVVVEIDVASLDTGNEDRDDHLRTADFFEVETWPVARVRAGGLTPKPQSATEPSDEAQAEAPRDEYSALFEIEMHGVKRTLVGTVWVANEAPPTIEGEFVIDRLEFGIGDEPSFWNPMSIDAEVPVRFRYSPTAHP